MKSSLAATGTILLIIWASLLCIPLMTEGASEPFVDGPEARGELYHQVIPLFKQKKFAELDAMADEFRKTKSRFADGTWKLRCFFSAFYLNTKDPEATYTEYIQLATEWHRNHLSSVTAQGVLAKAWLDYAWKARGGSYAKDVADEAWPLMEERLEKAWLIVSEPLEPGVNDCPNRLNLRIRMARTRSMDRDTMESFFEKAIRNEPGYYEHYIMKAAYLLPKWHGSRSQWLRFIKDIEKQNPEGEGATIYARTAWKMYFRKGWEKFERFGVSWPKMKAGFEQINSKYPNSYYNINTFARFACVAKDKQTLKKAFGTIDKGHYRSTAWTGENIDACRSFAGVKSRDELNREEFAAMHTRQQNAFREVLRRAENGDKESMRIVAELYLAGMGTSEDTVAAYAWLAQDETKNKRQLDAIAETLTEKQLQKAKQQAEAIRSRINKQEK